MTRRGCVLIAALAMIVASWRVETQAQSQPSLARYRFLPRFSVLNQTGGIAGVDVDFRVYGAFDLAVRPSDDVPPLPSTAKITNVKAWASHPILAYVLPLDETLNLSGLNGVQIPVAAPIDIYYFSGETGDGSQVNLYASVIGRWLHLTGETHAPPGSADYFEFEVRALAHRAPFADFNGNDVIDRGDLTRWMERFGAHVTVDDGMSLGDANGDHVVDGADFLEWQRGLGVTAPPMESFDAMVSAALATAAASSSQAAASIPEPASLGMLAIGAAFLARMQRHRHVPSTLRT